MILGCTVVSARFQAYAPCFRESIVQHGELSFENAFNCTESAEQPWSAWNVEF